MSAKTILAIRAYDGNTIKYDSMEFAAKVLGVHKNTIYKAIKNNTSIIIHGDEYYFDLLLRFSDIEE